MGDTPATRTQAGYLSLAGVSPSGFVEVWKRKARDFLAECVFSELSSVYPSRMGAITCFFAAMALDDTKVLARALRRRDPEVLDRLIEQYQYRLFRYLLYISGNRETAEDLFQETWIRVLDRGHQYDSKSRFDTWLFAIGRNLVIDLQRRKKPRSLDALTGPDQKSPMDLAEVNSPSALDLIVNREMELGIQESLARLPAIHREVLVLRFQEDMALEEIATVLGAPVSTVKSRLYRGLQLLRELLERGNA